MPRRKSRIQQASVVTFFAERLRGLRIARGLTQRQVADDAKVTLSYISRLEAGGVAPGIDTVERLAAALNVHMTELLPQSPSQGSSEQSRDQLKALVEQVITKAGHDSVAMFHQLFARLTDPRLINR
ncbi:MAG TPA: helix-turn-helix transcriptional regulator [Gemmatales bacterium]|nr:helix-turn-helix transcriptional regulator [Gemmatales bacterium]